MNHVSWEDYKRKRAMKHKMQGQLTLNVGEGIHILKSEMNSIPHGAYVANIARDSTSQITIFWVKD